MLRSFADKEESHLEVQMVLICIPILNHAAGEMEKLLNIYVDGMSRLYGGNTRDQHLVVVYTRGDEMADKLINYPDVWDYLTDGAVDKLADPRDSMKQMQKISERLREFTRSELRADGFLKLAKPAKSKALRTAAQAEWIEPLHRLEERKKRPGSPDALITTMREIWLRDWRGRWLRDWIDRFVARHTLVTLGGEALEELLPIARDKGDDLRRTAIWLIKSIVQDATERLKPQAQHLLCPKHLVRFHPLKVRVSRWQAFTYYGCRDCGQSRDYRHFPGEIVAVLDAGMTGAEVESDGVLRVNWLQRGSLFNFDRVEITQATAEDREKPFLLTHHLI